MARNIHFFISFLFALNLVAQPNQISYRGKIINLEVLYGNAGFTIMLPKNNPVPIQNNAHRFKGYIKLDQFTKWNLSIGISPSTFDFENIAKTKATINNSMYVELKEKFEDCVFYRVYKENNCDLYLAKLKKGGKGFFSARVEGECSNFQALDAAEVLLKSISFTN